MRGFTLVEVLIAVLVMGLVAAASLKLAAISEKALVGVRAKEALIDEANAVMTFVLANPTAGSFGVSDDVSWKLEEKKSPLWTDKAIDIDKLMLESERRLGSGDMGAFQSKQLRWRELTVTRRGASLTLFVPHSENLAGVLSGDKK